MTLRKRLLWLFMPLLATSLAGVWLLSEWILLERFDRDDRQRLYDEVRILGNRLEAEKKRHLEITRTYAWWSASYSYMQHPSGNLVTQSLDLDLLGHLGFDFVVLLASNGQRVSERWKTALLERHAPGNGPPPLGRWQNDVLRRAVDLGALQASDDSAPSLSQWLLVEGVPLLLLSVPISDDSGQAPPRGALVAGLLLDRARLEELESQLDARLRLLPGPSPESGWRSLSSLGPNGGTLIGPTRLNGTTQQGALLFLDSHGTPQFRLEVSRTREAYLQGREAIRLFLGMALLIVLGALLLAYVALELWVIRRIQRLHREVAAIGGASAPSRLSDLGHDEIGQLAGEANHMLARLEQSEARDRAILESIRDGYFETDDKGIVLKVNTAFCRLLGYSSEELVGHSYQQLLDPQDIERARELRRRVRRGEQDASFAAPFKRHDGRRVNFETRVSPMLDAQGRFAGLRGILRDISLQVEYQQRLLDLAYRDSLTGLGNRKAFGEQLPQALQRTPEGTSLALLYIDLDHFKPVNDRLGHATGDAVLAEVGKRLRDNLRQPDLAFRLGGDEFAVLLQGTEAATAEHLARRLLHSLNDDYLVLGQRLDFLSASIGIALYPQDAGDSEALVQVADSAMYRAKHERNRYARPSVS